MHKNILLFLTFILVSLQLFSQSDQNKTILVNNTEYVLFKPSRELEAEIANGLRVRSTLIKLKTHPKLNLSERQYKSYARIIDSIQITDYATLKDSIGIVLNNGLSWNLNGLTPSAPKRFYRKIKKQQSRQNQTLLDYLKYLQFAYQWKKLNEFPFEMVDKFIYYQLVEIDKQKYIEMHYELIFTPDHKTTFSEKTIFVHPEL